MVQKKLPLINSAHGSETRNIINELIKLFNDMGYTYDEALQKAHDVLNEAQRKSNNVLTEAERVNAMNESVQQQINTLIAESGTSDAELLQVRTDVFGKTFSVAKDRLDHSQKRLYHIDENKNKEVMPKIKERKPMMTFVDDDGMADVLTKWEPILQGKGNKLTIAVVPSWVESPTSSAMGWDEVHRLHDTYDVEIVNHTYEHRHANNSTETQIHNEFREAKRILEREGFTHDIIVQPFGENNASVRKISRQYARANVATKEGINYPPLETYRLNRVTLGEETNNTWEHYKSVLDEAIENDGWIIFKSHSQYASFDNTQIEHIKSIIDYARMNGIAEVSLEEGLDLVGNIMDIGDYPAREQAWLPEYTVMDYQGVIHSKSNSRDFMNYRYNEVSATTPISFFTPNTKSMCTITGGSNTTGFPRNLPGVIETVRAYIVDQSYQLYHPIRSNDVYKRHLESDGSWSEFEKISTASGIEEINFSTWTSQTIVPAKGIGVTVKNNSLTANVELGDYIQASPVTYLPNGIIFNVLVKADAEIEVRFLNMTDSQITIPSTYFNFKVEKIS